MPLALCTAAGSYSCVVVRRREEKGGGGEGYSCCDCFDDRARRRRRFDWEGVGGSIAAFVRSLTLRWALTVMGTDCGGH